VSYVNVGAKIVVLPPLVEICVGAPTPASRDYPVAYTSSLDRRC